MKDLHTKLQLEPIDEYAHSLADYLGCNEGEMLKELKQREQATINATRAYDRELIERKFEMRPSSDDGVWRNEMGYEWDEHQADLMALIIADLLTLLTDNNNKNDN